jgi:glycine dehydrogenase
MTEYEYANHIRLLGRTNKVYKSYIGLGYHPTIIQRNIFENPGWYLHTSKQKLHRKTGSNFKFQTTVIELTGMEYQCIILDESTAAAEQLCLLMFVQEIKESKCL